jgi:hypothetical protein
MPEGSSECEKLCFLLKIWAVSVVRHDQHSGEAVRSRAANLRAESRAEKLVDRGRCSRTRAVGSRGMSVSWLSAQLQSIRQLVRGSEPIPGSIHKHASEWYGEFFTIWLLVRFKRGCNELRRALLFNPLSSGTRLTHQRNC